jgi:hypothetical protein
MQASSWDLFEGMLLCLGHWVLLGLVWVCLEKMTKTLSATNILKACHRRVCQTGEWSVKKFAHRMVFQGFGGRKKG